MSDARKIRIADLKKYLKARGVKPRTRIKRQLFPLTAEREYMRYLNSLIAFMRAITRTTLIPALQHLSTQATRHHPLRQDAWGHDVKNLIDNVQIKYREINTLDDLAAHAKKAALATNTFNEAQIEAQMNQVLGVDLFIDDPWLFDQVTAFTVQNVELITSMEDETFGKVSQLVFTGLNTGRRWEDIAADISDRFDVAESRANLIARDQIGKLNGQLTMLRQSELGIKRYTWATANDDRVRDTHAEKSGEIFEWDDPPADTGHPGEDYQCRCSAEPVVEDLLG